MVSRPVSLHVCPHCLQSTRPQERAGCFTKTVFLLYVFMGFVFDPCFVKQYFAPSLVLQSSAGEERVDFSTFIVFCMWYGCYRSLPLHHGACLF